MKCPSLYHLSNVNLKCTLSDISISTPACLLGAHRPGKFSSSLSPVFIFVNKMGLL
jgi:hypothetical protein